ncbi:MAG: hypothetical protein P9X24_09195 [Candidatus Hatepunaea meridiana]|nr:hypothetical protein [Candidatus Hatepunaea meridiana]
MSINKTLNYMLAKQAEVLLNFSGQVTMSSTYLKGAGGELGDGFPLPKNARIYRIDCWDGTSLVSDSGDVAANQGDRLSVYANQNAGVFDVYVQINGVNSSLVATGAVNNTTLMVTVHLKLI